MDKKEAPDTQKGMHDFSMEEEIMKSMQQLTAETEKEAARTVPVSKKEEPSSLKNYKNNSKKEKTSMTEKMNTMGKTPKVGNSRKKIWIGVGIAIAVLIIVYLGMSFYFKDRFLFGTVVNGTKVAGKTVEQVETAMAEDVEAYRLTLEQRGDVTEDIVASEIGLEFVSDGEVQRLLDSQNSFEWPVSLFKKATTELKATVRYDEEKLRTAFDKLDAFNPEKVTEPVSAYPEYSESEGKYIIVEEVYGNLVKKEELYALLDPALTSGVTSVSLDENDCYVDPEYRAESAEVVQTTETLNTYVSADIKYQFGDTTEVVDGSEINKWLTVSEDWTVEIDAELVREFVNHIGSTYNTIGKTRNFTTTGGQTVQITQGDYGWNLKRDAETEELIECIREGYQGVKEPNYHRKGKNFTDQDWGNTYVEISISQQHMWFYKNGELLVSTDIVTGDSTRLYKGASRETPRGIYMITYKDKNATLTGEDYASPVEFWLPFYYNVGIHDASWRSSFGGNIYQGNGSHGCVNTPRDKVKVIWENIEQYDPVIVY